MTRQLLAAVAALTSTFVFGAVDRTPVDAFLARTDSRPLADAPHLSARALDALRHGHVSGTEARLGVPVFFWGPGRVAGVRTFRAQGLSAEQAARRYLYAHAELYRGAPARWAEATLTQLHDLGDGGAVIATFQQKVRGLPVFRDEVKVVMTKELELVALSGYLTPETKVRGEFRLAPEQAVGLAVENVTGRPLDFEALTGLEPQGGYRRFALAGSETPVRLKPVYFPLPEGVVPGFYVEVDLPTEDGEPAYFSFVVSAHDGSVLFKKDLTAWDFSYRVWATADGLPMDGPQGNDPSPHPTGTLNALTPPYVAPALLTLSHGPISTMDPWLAPGATTTQGNNVFAYIDAVRSNGYNTGDFLPTTTAPDTFDRVYDVNVSPDVNANQRMAAATQLFYDNNFFHDWYYDVGFDEAAGNAQADNYGRGGQANDVLRAEGQDYSGRNNANMSTPSDGASPRMQMYIFDAESAASLTVTGGTPASPAVNTATFGPGSFDVTATLVLADDGSTASGGTTSDACSPLTNTVTGMIVLVDRGVCQFITKVQNAQSAGAVGVIIADNRTANTPPSLSGSGTVTTPALSITQAAGTALKSSLMAGTVSVRMKRDPTVDRDGTLDNAIVAHEWGHYISNRLIGDGNGLSNNQAVGMGEGWADFHAMLMVVKATDDQLAVNSTWNGVYALAAYTSAATDPNGYYFGIRRVPYSTDFTKNGLTFKHIQQGVRLPSTMPVAYGADGSYNAEVHSTGEVWCAMLWEVYAALLNDPRYTFTQAQDLMKRYLVGGYKATPIMPTFTDARDALLAVAAARDPQDFVLMWQAFGRRGLGMLAVAPPRDSRTNNPTVESFDVGNALVVTDLSLNDVASSCDNDGRLDNDEIGNLSITIRNIGISALAQTSATVSTTSTGVTFPGGTMVTFPQVAPFATATVVVPVALRGVSGVGGVSLDVAVNDPSLVRPGPITVAGNFRVNYDVMPNGSATDDVESPASPWTVGNDPRYNTGSDWRIFQSAATEHWWFGPNPASPADTFVTSPSLTVSATQPLVITFRHRYDFEKDATTLYDGGFIEVSTNGGMNWADVGQYVTPGYDGALSNQGANPQGGRQAFAGQSPNYPAFVNATLDLGTRYAGQTVLLRFRIGADDAAAAKGWEIDDISFSGIDNLPFSAVVVDTNTCTNAPPVLTIGPNQTVDEGTAVTLEGSAYDPNGDLVTLTWTQKSGPTVTLAGNLFTAPQVDADTPMEFELTATDGTTVVGPRSVTITVQNVNGAPTVSAPAVLEVEEGQPLTIVATGSDPDGDALTYAWTQVDGPPGTLSGEATDSLKVTAPVVEADALMVFEVTASDSTFTSAPARVEVVVKNKVLQPIPGEVGPKARGCGCTSGMELAPLLFGLVALLGFRRRK